MLPATRFPVTVLAAVALGGAVGSMLRYVLGNVIARPGGFPLGTLLINVGGSLLLGFLFASMRDPAGSNELRAGLTAGLCGGFTTFSTFSVETVALLQGGAPLRATAYVAASVLVSLAAAAAGLLLGARA